MNMRIKELRQKNLLSTNQIAEYLNISVSLYESYESGTEKISVTILSKLAKKYHTSIDYLVGDTDLFTPHEKINF